MNQSCAESGEVEEQSSGDGSCFSLCRSTQLVDRDTCLPGDLLKLRKRIDGTASPGGAMAVKMDQAVAQLQRKLFALKAQVAAESGLADAVRAINNLANAQVPEGHSEPHRRERPLSYKGILLQRVGFTAVVQENRGLLRWSDQGVRDDA